MRGRAVSDPVVRIMPVNDPAILRELAALIEQRKARARPVARLSDAKLAELAQMVTDGQVPTLGWWRRALKASDRRGIA